MAVTKKLVTKKMQPGSQSFNDQLTVPSISLQSSAVAGESLPQPSIEDSQTGAARYSLQTGQIPSIQSQHKLIQDKLRKTRTDEPGAAQLPQMHHSPDDEATKTDQPLTKVQRTPVARKRLVIPAMSPTSKPDSKQQL